ncbi:MAG TPA: DUF6036 family nucleotidyltransferase [Thermoanaerobaculia bacterium]
MNRDFVEMLQALSESGAEFMVVGAYALAAHERPRATGDIDIWVRPAPENARLVWTALLRFGAPLEDLTVDDLSQPGIIFQIGRVPKRIDILTQISGVSFDEAWPNRILVESDGVRYAVIGKHELIQNKLATGRPKDLVDVRNLERQ